MGIGYMTSQIVSAVGNMIGAIILLIIALIVASICKKITLKLLNTKALEEFFNKLDGENISKNEDLSFINLIGKLVYGLVFFFFLIQILDLLGMSSIANLISSIYMSIFNFIPNLIVAVLLIVAGVIVAKFVKKIVYILLYKTRIDELVMKIMFEDENRAGIQITNIVSWVAYVLILLTFVTQAAAIVNLAIFTNILNFVIYLIPAVLATMIILIGSYILANFLFGLITKSLKTKNDNIFAVVVKYAVIVMGIGLALNQLGFNVQLLNITYIIVLLTVAIAAVIAFGVGGIDAAKKIINKQVDKLDK